MSKEGQGLKERNYARGPGSEISGQERTVSVGALQPNPWNYNSMSAATFNKLVASMRELGFTTPIICRTLTKTRWEIVDGEHRWRAAKELSMPAVRIIDLGQLPDEKAKQLTIILNELGGQADQVRLADLLRDINQSVDFAKLAEVMPYSDKELNALIEACDFSFATMSDEDTRTKQAGPAQEEDDPEADPETATPKDAPAVEVPEEELEFADEEDERAGGPPMRVSKITLAVPAAEVKALEMKLMQIDNDPVKAIQKAVDSYLALKKAGDDLAKKKREPITGGLKEKLVAE